MTQGKLALSPRRKARRAPGDIAFDTINCLFFGLFTLACVFPFYYLFINTISDNQASSLGDVMFWPVGVHFNNYVEVLKIRGIGRAALLSVGRTVIGTTLRLSVHQGKDVDAQILVSVYRCDDVL